MVDPAQRLAAAPGIQRVPTRELDLFIVRGFLDAEACAGLIRRIDEKRRPSDIADDVGIADFRTSETCDLDWRDPVVAAVPVAVMSGATDAKERAQTLGAVATVTKPIDFDALLAVVRQYCV